MPGAASRLVLLVACVGVGVACALLGERRVQRPSGADVATEAQKAPATPEPAKPIAQGTTPPEDRIRFPRVPGNLREPGASEPAGRRVLGPEEYELREYVDLTARVSPYPARVNGALWL